MKQVLFTISIAAIISGSSCSGNQNDTTTTVDSTTVSADTTVSSANSAGANTMPADSSVNNMTPPKGQPVTSKDVVDFVHKASSGGMMEVEMGNMAVSHGQSQRVKDYGNMLVQDHTMAGNELKSLAMSNSIDVPASMMPDHKAEMDKLMNKQGADFDKAYIDMMVKDHKTDIAEYKKASTDLSEASYKALAAKTLPVLQKHLDSAMAIQKSMK